MVVVERETLEPEDEVGPGGGEVAGLPRVARQVIHLYSPMQYRPQAALTTSSKAGSPRSSNPPAPFASR